MNLHDVMGESRAGGRGNEASSKMTPRQDISDEDTLSSAFKEQYLPHYIDYFLSYDCINTCITPLYIRMCILNNFSII